MASKVVTIWIIMKETCDENDKRWKKTKIKTYFEVFRPEPSFISWHFISMALLSNRGQLVTHHFLYFACRYDNWLILESELKNGFVGFDLWVLCIQVKKRKTRAENEDENNEICILRANMAGILPS